MSEQKLASDRTDVKHNSSKVRPYRVGVNVPVALASSRQRYRSAPFYCWSGDALIAGEGFFFSVALGGAALAIIRCVRGLLRMAMLVRDQQDADEFRNSFAEIVQALRPIHEQIQPPPLAPGHFPDRASGSLF